MPQSQLAIVVQTGQLFHDYAMWCWQQDLPRHLNDADEFELASQPYGFAGAPRVGILRDLAKTLNPRIDEDGFVALLEEVLAPELEPLGLGLRFGHNTGGLVTQRLVYLYRK